MLLAGLFRLEPYELVEGTTYPQAKIERLPAVVSRFTQLELDLAILNNGLGWIERLARHLFSTADLEMIIQSWLEQLARSKEKNLNDMERDMLTNAQIKLRRSMKKE